MTDDGAMQTEPRPWDSPKAMAADLGVPYPTVSSWGPRGIPAVRWREIADAAARRGVTLSLDQIATMKLSDLAGPGPAKKDQAA